MCSNNCSCSQMQDGSGVQAMMHRPTSSCICMSLYRSQVSGLRVACTGLHRQVCMYRCACTGLYVQVCVYRSQVCMLYCSATCRPEWACEHHHLLSVQIPSQWSCSACCHQTTSCTGSCCTSDSHEPIHNHAALPQPATKAVTTVRCETDSIHAGHLVACLKQAYTYAVQL